MAHLRLWGAGRGRTGTVQGMHGPHFEGLAAVRGQPPKGPNLRTGKKTVSLVARQVTPECTFVAAGVFCLRQDF